MHTVGAFEAKNKLSALLEEVRQGGEVVITVRGNPVARLVPFQAQPDRKAAEAALDRILARSRGVTLGGMRIRDLADEGRR